MRPIRPLARAGVLPAAAVFLALAACQPASQQPAAPPPVAPTPAASPPSPMPPPVVNRAELLRAMDAASAAYAAGQADEAPNLAGRRFVVRQAFGCSGASAGADTPAGLATWSWGQKNRTIELRLQPADWKAGPPAGAIAAEPSWEAVEGFWLTRPWLRADGCPAQHTASPATTDPAPLTRQTAGLAAVFGQDGSRVGRRDGRAFTHTIRGDDGPPAAPMAGYRLVLEGRFTAFPGGRALQCLAANADERPVCIAAANVDRIAFETAEGQLLAEWRPG